MVDLSKKPKKPIQGSLKVRGSGSRKVPSFNDSMMRYVGIPIVWCWLLSAMVIIFMGISAPDMVMANILAYSKK